MFLGSMLGPWHSQRSSVDAANSPTQKRHFDFPRAPRKFCKAGEVVHKTHTFSCSDVGPRGLSPRPWALLRKNPADHKSHRFRVGALGWESDAAGFLHSEPKGTSTDRALPYCASAAKRIGFGVFLPFSGAPPVERAATLSARWGELCADFTFSAFFLPRFMLGSCARARDLARRPPKKTLFLEGKLTPFFPHGCSLPPPIACRPVRFQGPLAWFLELSGRWARRRPPRNPLLLSNKSSYAKLSQVKC